MPTLRPPSAHRRARRLAAVLALLAVPAALRAQTAVVGTVTDSVAGRPLPEAVVQLVGRDRPELVHTAVADSLGGFRISGVARGRYLLGFFHPRLDSLRLRPPVREVEVGAAGTQREALATPSGRSIRAAICGPAADSSGLFLGRVQRADGDSIVDAGAAEVVVAWPEIVVGNGPPRQERRVVRAATDAEGHFVVCGVPTELSVLVHATAGDARSGAVELQAPPLGVVHRDLLVARAAAGDSAAPPRGSARLGGQVRTAAGQPVANAQVAVHGTGLADTTGADGRFALDSLPAGTFTLEARAIGYAPRGVAVDLRPGRRADADVTLDERVRTLDVVIVYGRRPRRSITGFLERSRGGFGRFITAEAIERRRPFEVTDALRMLPGVHVLPSSGFGFGNTVLLRGNDGRCVPDVFLDGMVIFEGAREIDRLVRPHDVMGIEVYAGVAGTPAEFSRGPCGSIVIWTRPPGATGDPRD